MYMQDTLFVKSDKIKDTCLTFLEKNKPYKAIRYYKNLYRFFDPETGNEVFDDNGNSIMAMIDQENTCAYLGGNQWELVEPGDV